ncbi:nitroreductase family deazaflavin-dependent oxidoreductase [Mycolicibacterium sp. BiH015]|uniref:nitroreductase family deazaflavin-dependent oxidoreductase n=1 Tax=Mycolicibacterium sp. BiH015 TaxID=3018808 RepID=UPI0022E6F8BB|nr:nitroreductase family deazaflavin-dependent oxidoreductase [Mycolicibacterium sp. BiH015]MDA2893280.1 nitroreductase family deazaflavin-dependent oxidoreductase [Mycolicibacterium sp. BiH015]
MTLTGDYIPGPWDWVHTTAGGVKMKGSPLVLLTTIGAKTGDIRRVPLMRIEHGGQYAVVASLGGAPRNPGWYYNVKAHPRVELQDGPIPREFHAREVFGDEKALWWHRAVAVWPDYSDYQAKTDRTIPVFVLTPTT